MDGNAHVPALYRVNLQVISDVQNWLDTAHCEKEPCKPSRRESEQLHRSNQVK